MFQYCIALILLFAPSFVDAICACVCMVCQPLPPPCPPPVICPPMVCPPPVPCPPPPPMQCEPVDPCGPGGMSSYPGGASGGRPPLPLQEGPVGGAGGGYPSGGYPSSGYPSSGYPSGGYSDGGPMGSGGPPMGGGGGGYAAGPASGFASSGRKPGRRRVRSVLEDLSAPKINANETALVDTLCSSAKLRRIMEATISDDTTESKLAIQKAAENEFHKLFNVMCTKGDFAYFAYTETFCQIAKAGITCYAF